MLTPVYICGFVANSISAIHMYSSIMIIITTLKCESMIKTLIASINNYSYLLHHLCVNNI